MGAPTSLVKFMGQRGGDGRGNLYWHRASIDGAPFRGQTPPMLRSDEFEDRLVRVADPHNRFFRLQDDKDNKAYLEVLDQIANGWAQLVFRHFYDKEREVYLEWVTYFMEDGSPTQAPSPTG